MARKKASMYTHTEGAMVEQLDGLGYATEGRELESELEQLAYRKLCSELGQDKAMKG